MNDRNKNTINYAGYGLFADEEFGRTLFGENTPSYTVEMSGYELVVLSSNELPSEIRDEMPPSYRIYAARKKEGATLALRFWELTRQQKELADQWNWGDKIYSRETFMSDIYSRPIEMDFITNDNIGKVVDGVNYEPYLNDKDIVLQFAREAHSASVFNKEGSNLTRERMH